jgi:hypothetical protein
VSTQGAGAGAQGPGGQMPSEAELLEALRRIKVDDVLLQTVVSLVNLAGQKLTIEEAHDPVEAKKAIDAVRTMLPLCPEEELGPIRDALSQVQMLYVKAQGAGASEAEGAPGESSQAPPAQATPEDEAAAREREERAKARAKIWTPGS